VYCLGALLLAGCRPTQQAAPAESAAAARSAEAADEVRGVAETSLGKQAEILAQGNLALNGREQVLVVNRVAGSAARSAMGSAIFLTRAAILQRDGGKWSEVLLCDEFLKNPYGYLGRSPAGRVTGWRLEFRQDAKEGLELKFTPAEPIDASNANADKSSKEEYPTFDVRWNKNEKRYQAYDQSHERYLSEIPSLETPQSTLR
jgi:hypothetical protein